MNLYPESGEPMHVLGISVKCPLIEVMLGMIFLENQYPGKIVPNVLLNLTEKKNLACSNAI